MLGREVPVDERRQRICRAVDHLLGCALGLRIRVLGGLGDQLVAGPEVLVEAAVGQAGGGHDLRHAGRLGAGLTDPPRGDLDDPVVVARLLGL